MLLNLINYLNETDSPETKNFKARKNMIKLRHLPFKNFKLMPKLSIELEFPVLVSFDWSISIYSCFLNKILLFMELYWELICCAGCTVPCERCLENCLEKCLKSSWKKRLQFQSNYLPWNHIVFLHDLACRQTNNKGLTLEFSWQFMFRCTDSFTLYNINQKGSSSTNLFILGSHGSS